jgi:hypothetical protein
MKASLADLGANPLAWRLLALHAAVLGAMVCLCVWLGLSVRWSSQASVALVMLGALFGLWLYFVFVPGTPNDRAMAELVFVVGLMVLFTAIGSPAQYAAVAVRFPYADGWLAAADARLGVFVPPLADWTRAHPAVSRLLTLSYISLTPQFLVAVLGLSALRRRERLWEYVFHFHVCLAIALAALVVWPAVCPPAYYGFASTIDMSHTIAQIKGFHDGTMKTINLDELEGLVSFPSFHTAGGLIVTWVFRGYRWIQIPLIVLNIAMIASTFLTGVHYVIDVLAAAPLFAISLAAWRWRGRRHVAARSRA